MILNAACVCGGSSCSSEGSPVGGGGSDVGSVLAGGGCSRGISDVVMDAGEPTDVKVIVNAFGGGEVSVNMELLMVVM